MYKIKLTSAGALAALFAGHVAAQSVTTDAQYTGNQMLCTVSNNRDVAIRVRQVIYHWQCQALNGMVAHYNKALNCRADKQDCDVAAGSSWDDEGLTRTSDCNVIAVSCDARIVELK